MTATTLRSTSRTPGAAASYLPLRAAAALTGRPGPVVVALPEDMLTAMTEAAPLSGPAAIFEAAPAPENAEPA